MAYNIQGMSYTELPNGYFINNNIIFQPIDTKTAAAAGWTGNWLNQTIELEDVVFDKVTGHTYSVVKISASAFKDCPMKKIILPESVKAIEENAFQGCNNLEYNSYGENVNTSYYLGCSNGNRYYCLASINSEAEEIAIHENCEILLADCIKEHTTLKTLIIKDKVRFIGKRFCENCSALLALDWMAGNAVITRENNERICKGSSLMVQIKASSQCLAAIDVDVLSKIISFTIYNGIVQDFFFPKGAAVSEIHILKGVSKIETSVFSGCPELRILDIEDGSDRLIIEESAFKECLLLQDLIFKRPVRIGASAFQGCSAITSIHFQKEIQDGYDVNTKPGIGKQAFYNCDKINTVAFKTIQKEITFGEDAFGFDPKENRNIPEIRIELHESIQNWYTYCNFKNAASNPLSRNVVNSFWITTNQQEKEITELNIPLGQKSILKNYAFINAAFLKKIKITASNNTALGLDNNGQALADLSEKAQFGTGCFSNITNLESLSISASWLQLFFDNGDSTTKVPEIHILASDGIGKVLLSWDDYLLIQSHIDGLGSVNEQNEITFGSAILEFDINIILPELGDGFQPRVLNTLMIGTHHTGKFINQYKVKTLIITGSEDNRAQVDLTEMIQNVNNLSILYNNVLELIYSDSIKSFIWSYDSTAANSPYIVMPKLISFTTPILTIQGMTLGPTAHGSMLNHFFYGWADIKPSPYRVIENLKKITITNSLGADATISPYYFAYCEQLAEIEFTNRFNSLTIGDNAFVSPSNYSDKIIPISELDFSTNILKISEKSFTNAQFVRLEMHDVETVEGRTGNNIFAACNRLQILKAPVSFINLAFNSNNLDFPLIYLEGYADSKNSKLDNYILSRAPSTLTTLKLSEISSFGKLLGFSYHDIRNGLFRKKFPRFETLIITDKIGSNAFYEFINTNIDFYIDISTVTEIHDYAFYQSRLVTNEKVILGGINRPPLTIGKKAFADCNWMTAINQLPITSIGEEAFYQCQKLETFISSSDLIVLGARAFKNCKQLTTVDLTQSLVSIIPSEAFYGCNQLQQISLPKYIETIDTLSFMNCSLLSTDFLIDKDNIKIIGRDAFHDNPLLNISLYNASLKLIDMRSFSGSNVNTIDIHMPYDKDTIHKDAFSGCRPKILILSDLRWLSLFGDAYLQNIEELSLDTEILDFNEIDRDNTLKTRFAIVLNKNGNSLSLSNSLTKISGAWPADLGITNIYFNGTVEDWCSIEFESFASNPLYALPNVKLYFTGTNAEAPIQEWTELFLNNISKINKNTFVFNENNKPQGLKTLTIGSTVREIGEYAFYNAPFESVTWEPADENAIMRKECFANCNSLKTFNASTDGIFIVLDKITTIERGVFANIPNIINLTVPLFKERVVNTDMQTYPENLFGYIFWQEHITKNYDTEYFELIENEVNGFVYSVYIPKNLTTITLSQATYIPNQAFENYNHLIDFTLRNPIEEIGMKAFNNCSALKLFPIDDTMQKENLYKIGAAAFQNCSEIEEVFISEYCTYIGDDAFKDCKKITKMTLPFLGNSLSARNPDVTINKIYSNGGALRHLVIKNTQVQEPITLQTNSFDAVKSSLQEIELHIKVEQIPERTFYMFASLEKIILPDSISSIGAAAFEGCINLISLHSELSDTIEEETIDLTSFEKLSVIEEKLFFNCQNIERIKLPNTITILKDSCCYCDNQLSKLTSITGIENVREIGNQVFEGCLDLWILLDEFTHLEIIGDKAFFNCRYFDITEIPDSVTRIGAYAFAGCQLFSTIKFKENVEFIGIGVLYGCLISNLTLTYLLRMPDRFKTELTSISYLFADEYGKADNFTNIPLEEITVLKGKVWDYAFKDCLNVHTITLGAEVELMESNGIFMNCENLRILNYGIKNDIDKTVNNTIFTNAGTLFGGIDIYIGNNVTRIPNYFSNDIANSIKEFHISENSQLKEIGCYSCQSRLLQSFTVPQSVEQIGVSAFKGCPNLTELTLSEGIEKIPESLCEDCHWLRSISISKTVKEIASKAFYNCHSLKNIVFAEDSQCKIIQQEAFARDGSSILPEPITELIFPQGLEKIEDKAFNNVLLNKVCFVGGSSCSSIGKLAFYGNSDDNSTTIYLNIINPININNAFANLTVYFSDTRVVWESIIGANSLVNVTVHCIDEDSYQEEYQNSKQYMTNESDYYYEIWAYDPEYECYRSFPEWELVHIKTDDWRTELYLRGIENSKSTFTNNYYAAELNAEWPKIYDITKSKDGQEIFAFTAIPVYSGGYKELNKSNYEYWIDFLSGDTGGNVNFSQYNVNNIGRRQKVVSDSNSNTIFPVEVPNVLIFSNNKDNIEDINIAEKQGYKVAIVGDDIYQNLSVGGGQNAAFDKVKELLINHTQYAENINLSTIPIYYLEPNTRVSIFNNNLGIYGDYLIKTISLPLTPNGTANITATKCIEKTI